MHPRVQEEWQDLTSLYPAARHSASPEYIELTLPLPSGLYDQTETAIRVFIPVGYRATAPDGFLVPNGLRLRSGSLPASDATSLGMPGWQIISFHFMDASGASTWRPTADPIRGDNLIGYVEAIRAFLAAACN